jgi:hypothetical protein
VPHLTTDHHTTAYVTPQHNEQEKPTMDCLPSMLFTATRRVSAASHQIIPKIPPHIRHDHRQPFQITTLPATPAGIHKNMIIRVCQFIVTVAASNQGRQLRKLKFMSRQVFRSIRFSGNDI